MRVCCCYQALQLVDLSGMRQSVVPHSIMQSLNKLQPQLAIQWAH